MQSSVISISITVSHSFSTRFVTPHFLTSLSMATITTSSLFYTPSSFTAKPSSSRATRNVSLNPRSRNVLKIRATGPDLLGDYGARDPFPEEIESNFGENVLGNMSTEHKILIPQASALSLAQQPCTPISPNTVPIPHDVAKQLLYKVIGWRLVESEDDDGKTVLKLQCLWKLKDSESGVELINRIDKVAENAGHFPVFHQVEGSNQVTAELWTREIGGLSINDFIVAAKIDEVKITDLLPRKRVWA